MPNAPCAPVSPSPQRSTRHLWATSLHVRVGIATGLVVIGEPIGSGDSRQQTAVGETPNLGPVCRASPGLIRW
jgi:class 3 adenylate cyclase